MKIVYSDDPIDSELLRFDTIFLAGPTPRNPDVKSWRPEAIQELIIQNFDGVILIPEFKSFQSRIDFLDQVNWERFWLENCKKIVCWVPRNMTNMPALTTNVEFGRYVTSGRLYYGRPDGACHTNYLDWLYNLETKRNACLSLSDLIKEVLI